MENKKLFTLEEAKILLPQLKKVIPRIQKLSRNLKNDYPDVQKAWENVNFNGGSIQGVDYLVTALEYKKIVTEIESKGCILKGVSEGLVDFPSIRDGKEVYLCWKSPEEDIQYWHDIDAGFSGRKKI